jgi:SOS response associated peptidase (SRAP)
MCNLYSITTNPAAIAALFRVMNRYVGSLPPMPGVFPDYPAPVVRNTGDGGELTMMRWGMPPPPRTGGPPVTNIRNTSSPHWRGWLKPENRCLVPVNSFAEYAPGSTKERRGLVRSERRPPLFAFAGMKDSRRQIKGIDARVADGISAPRFLKSRKIVPATRQRTTGPFLSHLHIRQANETDLEHGAQRIFLSQLLGDPTVLKAKHGCPGEVHFSGRSSWERTQTKITKGRPGVSAPALPSANDVIAFCNEITDPSETEIGKSVAKLRHKNSNGRAPFLWIVHWVVQEYVRCGQFVHDSWIPGVSPEFLEPARYDVLIVLRHSNHLRSFDAGPGKAEPAASLCRVISIREMFTATRFPSHCLIVGEDSATALAKLQSIPQIGWFAAAKPLPCFNTYRSTLCASFTRLPPCAATDFGPNCKHYSIVSTLIQAPNSL